MKYINVSLTNTILCDKSCTEDNAD